MNITTGIIADDFTGAGDSSIHFCLAGYSVYLPLSFDNPIIPDQTGVLAVNSETRLLEESEAYDKVCRVVKQCRALGVRSFYKKIDSTLRGNIASEVKAVMDCADYQIALICPAAPEIGRTVVDGQCLINNQPIKETESSKDHLNPVKSSYVKDLFSSVGAEKIRYFTREDLGKGTSVLEARIDDFIRTGITHIVCDGSSPEDLDTIASLFADQRLLLVGSAGLAKAVSTSLGRHAVPEENSVFAGDLTLVISGSRMEVTRKQIAKLAEERGFGIMTIPVDAILDQDRKALDRFRSSLEEMDSYAPVILIPGENTREEKPEDIRNNSELIADFMGETAAQICRKQKIQVLITIGGHTAYKTMKKLKASGVMYQGEVLPGTPYGRLMTRDISQPLALITKSGSFGNEDALVSIVDFVEERMKERV